MKQQALLFVCCCCWCFHVASAISEEDFSEELLLRTLPDGNVLSHFHFSTRLPLVHLHGVHHRLLPKAIFQLVQKYRIKEMELSFTQGRWSYHKWGALDAISQVASKPVGVELSASFDVPEHLVDSTWGNLTNALSGLFCASINFLESPTTFMDPWFSYRPDEARNRTEIFSDESKGSKRMVTGRRSRKSGTRYGCLPREAVCTENLTPWLKLLPCRDKAGLTTLLDRPTIYSGLYHSLRLLIRSGDFDKKFEAGGTTLDQTLTIVLRDAASFSSAASKLPNWSLSRIFGSKLTGTCPLATKSSVYLELEEGVVKHLVNASEGKLKVNYADNSVFSIITTPDRVLTGSGESNSVLLEFDVSRLSELDVGVIWRTQVKWRPSRGPYFVSRFLTGSGNARGSLVMYFQADGGACCGNDEGSLGGNRDLTLLQMVPWYVRLYGHTMRVKLDGEEVEFWSAVRLMRFSPAEDRKSPAAIELALRVPAAARIITVTVEYDKGFLHIDEHPPDANRGFDLPSALVTFLDCRVAKRFDYRDELSPLVDVFQKQRPLQMYTEVLLLPLATPDFSMPYNVITLTCTVLALYFGSLLNALRGRRRNTEEGHGWMTEKLQKRFGWMKNKKYARLMKILLVVVVGVAVNHYSGS